MVLTPGCGASRLSTSFGRRWCCRPTLALGGGSLRSSWLCSRAQLNAEIVRRRAAVQSPVKNRLSGGSSGRPIARERMSAAGPRRLNRGISCVEERGPCASEGRRNQAGRRKVSRAKGQVAWPLYVRRLLVASKGRRVRPMGRKGDDRGHQRSNSSTL